MLTNNTGFISLKWLQQFEQGDQKSHILLTRIPILSPLSPPTVHHYIIQKEFEGNSKGQALPKEGYFERHRQRAERRILKKEGLLSWFYQCDEEKMAEKTSVFPTRKQAKSLSFFSEIVLYSMN